MKKHIATVLTVILASTYATAGTNFHNLIVENSKAQNELHNQIKHTVDDVKMAVNERVQDGDKTVSIAAETIHVKTDKNFMTFAKEKKYYKPSEKRAQKRLAEEFQNLE